LSARHAHWAAALALSAALATSGAAEAALAPAPGIFRVRPDTVKEGEAARIEVEPAGASGSFRSDFDLYIVWFSGPGAAFLTASGQWSAEPSTYRAKLTPGGFAPIVGPLRPPARAVGTMPLGAIFTRPGGHPLQRSDWVYQPQLVTVRLKASLAAVSNRSRALATLGGLGLLSLGASALVLWRAGRRSGA
jgi:hypothetical protein